MSGQQTAAYDANIGYSTTAVYSTILHRQQTIIRLSYSSSSMNRSRQHDANIGYYTTYIRQYIRQSYDYATPAVGYHTLRSRRLS